MNLPGTLNLLNLGMFIRTKGQETPRMVIYITKMDDCGDVFDALKQVFNFNIINANAFRKKLKSCAKILI